MSALFTQLEGLKVNKTPIEYPLPPDMHTPGASSTPSRNQAFVRKDELRYIAHDPTLVESIIGVFKDRLQEHPAAATATVDWTTTETVRDGIKLFETNVYDSYRECEIESGAEVLLRAVMKLVAAVDVLLGVPDASGAAVIRQRPVPIPETSGNPRAQYIPDLTLCRLIQDDSDPAAVPLRVAQTTFELKSPNASRNWFGPSAGAGLFVRAIHFVRSKGACKFDELPEDLKILLQKEIVAARSYDNDLFFFLDNFSWFIGLVVPTGEGNTYNVLLSDLQLVAPLPPSPSRLLLLVIISFYTKLFGIAKEFTAAMTARATAYAPPPVPAQEASLPPLDNVELTDEVHVVFLSGRSVRAFRCLPASSQSVSSLALSSSPNNARKACINLLSFVGDGSTSQVFSLMLGDAKHILKVTNRKVEGDVEGEIERLLELQSQPALADTVVPLRAVYRDADGRPMLLMPFAGKALEDWSSLTKEQRVALVVALMRLHQIGHIQHNDIAPRNVVVSNAPGAHPRIIDFTSATPGHECCSGSNCYEVNRLIHELDLTHDADLEEIGRKAAAEGLEW
ncbi:hypothetical protein JCM3770_005639 [Rhodotorula araucariae]